MTDTELVNQFHLCEKWDDGDQWELLGLEYYRQGYMMNANYCFRRADACFMAAQAEAVSVESV